MDGAPESWPIGILEKTVFRFPKKKNAELAPPEVLIGRLPAAMPWGHPPSPEMRYLLP